MTVLSHADADAHRLPGLEHRTVASLVNGTYTMEIWWQTMAPGAVTPVHHHACEEAIVILAGRGECRMHGRVEQFSANATLIIESDAVHQLANTGDEPLELIAVLGMTPVTVLGAAGDVMELPWDTPPRTVEPGIAPGADATAIAGRQ